MKIDSTRLYETYLKFIDRHIAILQKTLILKTCGETWELFQMWYDIISRMDDDDNCDDDEGGSGDDKERRRTTSEERFVCVIK